MTTRTINRYCRRAITLLAAGLWLAGCSDEPKAPLQPGEAEYARHCATCHARDGAGRPPGFPPLTGSEWLDLGPEAIALIVTLGLRGEIEVAGRSYRGYMPPMHQVKDDEMVAILGYINSQWAQWESVPDANAVAALREQAGDEELLEGRAALEQVLARISP